MADCTAKVTTADVTDEVLDDSGGSDAFVIINDGDTVQRQGDQIVRVDLHPLECDRDHSRPGADFHGKYREGSEDIYDETWTDDTPGATPHATPSDPDMCPHCKCEQLVGSFDTPISDPRRACPICKGSGRIDDVEVSDAEVEAAREAYLRTAESGHPSDTVSTGEAMREALLAAKRADKEQEDA